ncbi:hypothetical protein PB01_17685 [Psychrobacillus glaciei]|uniref:DUF1516 family protein n=1 Tax=Psychrobacillus glaciei TaxID=2283160 RepID=A0A5J6SR82_9BACI|nr:hypothetical protein [Psychrobacillus glaciei]QFG00486.1 hypothetical protein PB01_17685 [Psychrobacillus glaciei]
MTVITYVLISLYAILTGVAGIVQWKETGFQIRSLLFVIVAMGMLVTLFLLNKNMMFVSLIVLFIVLHILAIAEGMLKNGKLTYSHHIIRLNFHLVLLVFVFILIK